ncbi:unnamed protein product [Auanema sp. JU1783]|nr:unnamed protein product [Auanema sp. JU1783]
MILASSYSTFLCGEMKFIFLFISLLAVCQGVHVEYVDDEVLCPDGKSTCPLESTCCVLDGEDEFGCCPSVKATCCSDKLHCCPEGLQCDVQHKRCLNQFISTPWLVKVPAKRLLDVEKSNELSYYSDELDTIKCPDGVTSCPEESTCCLLVDGSYGCCPTVHATCCSDRLHCCPEGMTCDAARERCLGEEGTEIRWLNKIKPIQKKHNSLREVICPDRRSKCPPETTCCKLSSGSFGCCPLPKATCCSDGLHCCPEGMKCQVAEGGCSTDSGFLINWSTKFASTPIRQKVAIDIHPPVVVDNESELPEELKAVPCGKNKNCPALTTCCETKKNNVISHMCCPLQNAVCCENSCCPNGFRCYGSGKCEKHAVRQHNFFD